MANDRFDADLHGRVKTTGISEDGVFVDIATPSEGDRAAHGRVLVRSSNGQIRQIETYTEWSAPNEVRLKTKQKIWVSGGQFVGWIESNIETPTDKRFSRNVIEGEIEHEIRGSGAGFIEWTTLGGNNEIVSEATNDGTDNSNSDSTNDEELPTLPTVEIDSEGTFDGVIDTHLDIDADGDVEMEIDSFERVIVPVGSTTFEAIINQDFHFEGEADGDLSYDPDRDNGGDPTPTPTATPTPGPTATPIPGFFPTPTPFTGGVDFFDPTIDFNF